MARPCVAGCNINAPCALAFRSTFGTAHAIPSGGGSVRDGAGGRCAARTGARRSRGGAMVCHSQHRPRRVDMLSVARALSPLRRTTRRRRRILRPVSGVERPPLDLVTRHNATAEAFLRSFTNSCAAAALCQPCATISAIPADLTHSLCGGTYRGCTFRFALHSLQGASGHAE